MILVVTQKTKTPSPLVKSTVAPKVAEAAVTADVNKLTPPARLNVEVASSISSSSLEG